MNINNELKKFCQEKAQEFFTQELPNRLKGFEAALEGSKEETRKKMSEEDEARFSLIWNALMMDDTDDIKRTLNLSDHLMLKRIKERAEAQKV